MRGGGGGGEWLLKMNLASPVRSVGSNVPPFLAKQP